MPEQQEIPIEIESRGDWLRGQLEQIKGVDLEDADVFSGFRDSLRDSGVRVSTPEWMQFLEILQKRFTGDNLKAMVSNEAVFNALRSYGSTTLVKDKENEEAYHRAFDQYFMPEGFADVLIESVDQADIEESAESEPPDKKEQLGITEVADIDETDDSERDGEESVHGGSKDQHNDILRQEDESKEGGGSLKPGDDGQGENNEKSDFAVMTGGGKGSARIVERAEVEAEAQLKPITAQEVEERKDLAGRVSKDRQYEVRPTKAELRKVIKQLRRIISDSSEVATSNVDIKKTVDRFAQADFRVSYQRERMKQEPIVLLIDVGGPVDEWSPLVTEMAQEMTKGLTEMEVYLFQLQQSLWLCMATTIGQSS